MMGFSLRGDVAKLSYCKQQFGSVFFMIDPLFSLETTLLHKSCVLRVMMLEVFRGRTDHPLDNGRLKL